MNLAARSGILPTRRGRIDLFSRSIPRRVKVINNNDNGTVGINLGPMLFAIDIHPIAMK